MKSKAIKPYWVAARIPFGATSDLYGDELMVIGTSAPPSPDSIEVAVFLLATGESEEEAMDGVREYFADRWKVHEISLDVRSLTLKQLSRTARGDLSAKLVNRACLQLSTPLGIRKGCEWSYQEASRMAYEAFLQPRG